MSSDWEVCGGGWGGRSSSGTARPAGNQRALRALPARPGNGQQAAGRDGGTDDAARGACQQVLLVCGYKFYWCGAASAVVVVMPFLLYAKYLLALPHVTVHDVV